MDMEKAAYTDNFEDDFLFYDFMSKKSYKTRLIIFLFCDGWKYKDIASFLNMEEAAVRATIYRIRKEWFDG